MTHRAIAVDLRGHGDSHWDERGRYASTDYVADVFRVLKVLGIQEFTLVGHSLGGDIAIRIASTDLLRVTSLVVVDYGPGISREAREFARATLLRQFRSYKSMCEYAASLKETRPMASLDSLLNIAQHALRPGPAVDFRLKCDPLVAGTDDAASRDEPLLVSLKRIACPTLLIRGKASAMLSKANAVEMTLRLRHGRLQSIDKAGHAVMTDNPQQFSAAVHAFLQEVADGVAADGGNPGNPGRLKTKL